MMMLSLKNSLILKKTSAIYGVHQINWKEDTVGKTNIIFLMKFWEGS